MLSSRRLAPSLVKAWVLFLCFNTRPLIQSKSMAVSNMSVTGAPVLISHWDHLICVSTSGHIEYALIKTIQWLFDALDTGAEVVSGAELLHPVFLQPASLVRWVRAGVERTQRDDRELKIIKLQVINLNEHCLVEIVLSAGDTEEDEEHEEQSDHKQCFEDRIFHCCCQRGSQTLSTVFCWLLLSI